MKVIIVIILISSMCLAGESQFEIIPRGKRMGRKIPLTSRQVKSSPQNSGLGHALERIEAQNQKLITELGLFQERPAIWDFTNQFDLKTGSALKALLLNSVVSTNLESPLLVEVRSEQDLPVGTRFSCQGVVHGKRVLANCRRMIIPSSDLEYDVNVSLLNRDGSSGLKADYYYTGKEESVAGSLASSTLPISELASRATRHPLLSGITESTNEINEAIKNGSNGKESKVYIKAGREVIVYFNERFKL